MKEHRDTSMQEIGLGVIAGTGVGDGVGTGVGDGVGAGFSYSSHIVHATGGMLVFSWYRATDMDICTPCKETEPGLLSALEIMESLNNTSSPCIDTATSHPTS